MKKLIVTLLACYALSVHAQTNHLVISQIYGAGGNTDAPYTHDFVELYNPTSSTVSLEGWSLQYAGAGTDNWSSNFVTLRGSVAPGKYFLMRLGNPGSSGMALPPPDFIPTAPENISISATAGKVALVNNTTILLGICPLPNSAIIDFVGFGGGTCAEGTRAAATSNTKSISRNNNGCTDTDNNSSDFTQTAPSPRNSASAKHTCNAGSITINAVSPNPLCIDGTNSASGTVSYSATGSFTNSTFTATLSDGKGNFGFPVNIGSASVSGTNPNGSIPVIIPSGTASGTGYRIRIEATSPDIVSSQSNEFEIISGAKNLLSSQFWSAANNTTVKLNWINPTGCFDEILIVAKQGAFTATVPTGNGSAYTADLNFNGNGTTFDGGKVVYKGTTSGQTVTNLTNGVTYFFKAFTRRGTIWSSGIAISDRPRRVPLPGEIVINQFSPDYNSTLDEYVELVNLTDLSFDLSDVILDVKNSSGANVVAGGTLSGTIPPHGYWLILPENTPSITVGQTNAVAANTQIDLGFAPTNNQIGLIRATDSVIIDAVGYGPGITVPTYREGTAASNPPADGGLKRSISGADANNNSSDFIQVANANIELRNSNSRLANANSVIAAGNYTTLEVTGNATLSGNINLSDKIVLTSGIFSLNNYNLSAATATGSTAAKYIKTSGTGAFTITNITSGAMFPVGNSTFNPITISNGGGLNWSVRVADEIAPGPTPFYESAAVQRIWNVTPSATPATGATLVFEYDENDPSQLGSRFNKTRPVQVWNYHSNNWQAVSGKQTPATGASGRKTAILSNYTQFSPFAIVNEESLLPIHFTGFTARAQAGGVQLQFTNVSEKEVRHYDVQRSVNGQDFENIMQLTPQKNNGSEVTYRWLDAAPPAGDVWYRIKGLEADGTINFTPQLQVNLAGATNELTVYPNPVRGRAIVWKSTLPKGTYSVHVSGANGQQVTHQTITHSGGMRTKTIYLPAGLQPGIYRLQISNGAVIRRQSFVVL